jgi:exodeoxyribonuclease VII small subunit
LPTREALTRLAHSWTRGGARSNAEVVPTFAERASGGGMTGADEIASLSFEQALAELERIVAELESGKTDLEQSIDAYERGSHLKAHCEAKLKEAQLRVERIVIGPAGAAGVEPAEF